MFLSLKDIKSTLANIIFGSLFSINQNNNQALSQKQVHEESKRRVEARDRQKERERKEADEFTKSLLGTKKSTKPPGDLSKPTGTKKKPTIAELIAMTTRNSEKIKQLTGENGDLKKANSALQREKEALAQANETLTDQVSKSKESIQALTEANKQHSKEANARVPSAKGAHFGCQ